MNRLIQAKDVKDGQRIVLDSRVRRVLDYKDVGPDHARLRILVLSGRSSTEPEEVVFQRTELVQVLG